MSRDQAKIIINPVASGGKVGTRWPELRQSLVKLGLQFDFELTSHRGHAIDIARKAVGDGFRDIICYGGDGTVNEVVNGLVVDGQVPSEVVLSIIPGGTGADFVRIMGISRDPTKALEAAIGQRIRAVDVGAISCIRDGSPIVRYFVNVAGLGFDGESSVRVNRMSKRINGTLPYLASLVLTLASYTNKDVELTFDGQRKSGRFNSVIICNGQYFGGGMWIGPQAAADDGIFDVVILGDVSRLEFLLNVPRVYRGTHLTHPKVESFQAREVRVEAAQRMFVQAEGELVGEAPATFGIMPGALRLRV
jgi:diacylglycerol kinase (ATP)